MPKLTAAQMQLTNLGWHTQAYMDPKHPDEREDFVLAVPDISGGVVRFFKQWRVGFPPVSTQEVREAFGFETPEKAADRTVQHLDFRDLIIVRRVRLKYDPAVMVLRGAGNPDRLVQPVGILSKEVGGWQQKPKR